MLVLHRRSRERICIIAPGGERIWIQINELRSRSCRLGLSAPKTIRILREVVFRDLYPGETIPHDDLDRPEDDNGPYQG